MYGREGDGDRGLLLSRLAQTDGRGAVVALRSSDVTLAVQGSSGVTSILAVRGPRALHSSRQGNQQPQAHWPCSALSITGGGSSQGQSITCPALLTVGSH